MSSENNANSKGNNNNNNNNKEAGSTDQRKPKDLISHRVLTMIIIGKIMIIIIYRTICLQKDN